MTFMDYVLEQSEKVEREIRARDAASRRAEKTRNDAIVAEIIAAVSVTRPRVYSDHHRFSPYPNRDGCVRCPYPKEHEVHAGSLLI